MNMIATTAFLVYHHRGFVDSISTYCRQHINQGA